MQAGGAIGSSAGTAVLAENLADVFACEIGMLGHNRPVNEPIFTSGPPLVRSISAVSLTNSKGLIWLP
jgi:hypothetical protein